MIDLIGSILAAARAFFRSRLELSSEVLALRQQVAVLKRKRRRPLLSRMDRLFWIALRRVWPRWSNVVVIVKPATAIGWHRASFRLYWRSRSSRRSGRPRASEGGRFYTATLRPIPRRNGLCSNCGNRFLRNTFRPEMEGTKITAQATQTINSVKSIACKLDVTLLEIRSPHAGVSVAEGARNLINACQQHKVTANLFGMSDETVYVALDGREDHKQLSFSLEQCLEFRVRAHQAVLSLVGEGCMTTLRLSCTFRGLWLMLPL